MVLVLSNQPNVIVVMDLCDTLCDIHAVQISSDYMMTEAGELSYTSDNWDMWTASDLLSNWNEEE